MGKPKRGRSTAAIDDHVGARIRERRIMLGLTQQQLAEMIGVTYQKSHKYERSINRVAAGRLFQIARALSAPINYFFEGIGEEGPRQLMPHQRMQLEIARNFTEIRNEKHQQTASQPVEPTEQRPEGHLAPALQIGGKRRIASSDRYGQQLGEQRLGARSRSRRIARAALRAYRVLLRLCLEVR